MSEKKSVQSHIEELHQGIPREPIRGLKERIKSGEQAEAGTIKAEVNAMTAMYIEEVWRNALSDIETHPPGLLDFRRDLNIEGKHAEDSFVTPEQAQEIFSRPEVSDHFVFNILQRQTRNLLKEEVEKWAEDRQKKLSEDPNETSSRIFARYKSLIRHKNRLTDTAASFPNSHIQRGVGTASEVMWNTIRVVPATYKNRFSEHLAPEQYAKIARNSLPVIYAIASTHLGVFGKAHKQLKSQYGLAFDPANFYLAGEGENIRLEVQPAAFSRIDIDPTDYEEGRTGCPAMFAEGPSKRNVIAEMYEWLLDLAEKYYYPKFQEQTHE